MITCARNPFSFSFSIDASVSPSDNINNAPTTNTIVIGGLTFIDTSLLPISGFETNIGANLTYRLPATETRQSAFNLAYDARRVWLRSEAETINPTLQNGDFSSDRLSIGRPAHTC